ncbi:copper-binding protein [Pseudocitrobacter cyperus]|uniref:Copper-binding protein n=1 Tax=Pseudocitrobacter cyperus TaxID=3112843 RepID=A0ABV0HIS3_9ENTR
MSTIFTRVLTGALLSVSAFSVSAHDMSAHATMTMPSTATWQGEGIIKKVTPTAITIAHHPIPALNWPAMTMQFAQPATHPLTAQSVGEEVDFTFTEGDAGYQIVSLNPHR